MFEKQSAINSTMKFNILFIFLSRKDEVENITNLET